MRTPGAALGGQRAVPRCCALQHSRLSGQEKSPGLLHSTTESPEFERAPRVLTVPSRQLGEVQG